LRKDGFSERWTKNALNMPHLTSGKRSIQIGAGRSQKVVSQGGMEDGLTADPVRN
jgi:hypothetical protein